MKPLAYESRAIRFFGGRRERGRGSEISSSSNSTKVLLHEFPKAFPVKLHCFSYDESPATPHRRHSKTSLPTTIHHHAINSSQLSAFLTSPLLCQSPCEAWHARSRYAPRPSRFRHGPTRDAQSNISQNAPRPCGRGVMLLSAPFTRPPITPSIDERSICVLHSKTFSLLC